MKFTKDEIRKAMLLYAVTDQMWLKEGETLTDVVESVLQNGATFLQLKYIIQPFRKTVQFSRSVVSDS